MKKAFTLIELMVVVIIIGILATLAVPTYRKAVVRAQVAKAKHALSLIMQAEKMYYAENDTYILCNAEPLIPANLGKYMDLIEIVIDNDWDYFVYPPLGGNIEFGCVSQAIKRNEPYAGEIIKFTSQGVWDIPPEFD